MRIPPFALCALLLLAAAPADAGDDATPWTGRVVYEQTATGDSDGAKSFRSMAAKRVVVHFAKGMHRQDEEGGMNAGSYIVRADKVGSLKLDHTKRRTERGGAMDLEKTDEKVKAFMPWHFKTDLEKTDETDTILGHAVRRYKVKRSAFVRQGATAYVWIAEDVNLPKRRYQFEFEFTRAISPVPLSIPVPKGAILKAEILDQGTPVTITVTALEPGTPDPKLFEKPADYSGPDFKEKPKAKTAPQRPAMSAADIAKLPAKASTKSGISMVLIKPGTFRMGSPKDELSRRDDEGPLEVTLTNPYYIGVHEVTQKQWQAVMGEKSPSKFEGDDRPVENVTWAQAVAFCKKLSELEGKTFRLPTEAEWEFAARAGETVAYKPHKVFKAWLSEHAWQYFNAKYKSHPVGSLKPNAWGLYDTIGNVSEWTADGYGPYPEGKATNPAGTDAERKVIRGGNWITSFDMCRVARRGAQDPEAAKSTIGLRIVREP